VLRNNWSEVFLIGAEKMYTAAQRYRAEAATTKKKKRETRGRIEGEAARGWADECAERRERERGGGKEGDRVREKFPCRLTVGVARVFNRLPGVHSEIPSVNYVDFQCIQTPWNFYDCLTATLPTLNQGGRICTTEIFQGFNFINDHPVPAATLLTILARSITSASLFPAFYVSYETRRDG